MRHGGLGVVVLAVWLHGAALGAGEPESRPEPANTAAPTPAAKPVSGDGGWRWVREVEYHSADVREKGDDYLRSQCRLDLMLPKGGSGFDTVIWFHGGGLTRGKRYCPAGLGDKDTAVAGVGYRLYPKAGADRKLEVEGPIRDAAAAIAWVLEHIAEYGGDPGRVYVSGISAGGYLAAMVGLDPQYLAAHGRKPTDLAGVMPVSGMMTTHFQILKNRNDPRPMVVDELAPLFHAKADAPPFLLVVGDPAVEWPARVEENALLAAMLKRVKHKDVAYYSLPGFNHNQIAGPGALLCRQFMQARRPKDK